MGLISNIQDKLSSNKDHPESGVDSSRTHDTTTGGLTGQGSHLQQQTGTTSSSHPTHGTTATSNNPLSSNAAPYAGSGITGGTHPVVTGSNTTTGTGLGSTHNTTGYGSGEGSHLAGSTGQHSTTGLHGTQHSGSGFTGTQHSGSGLTGTSHSGSGLTGTQHSGSGLTGTSHSGTGLTGTSHSGSGLTGTSHSGSGLTGTSHTGQGIGSNTHSTGTGIGSNTHTTGSGLTGATHHKTHTTGSGLTGATHSTHTGSHDQRGVDFVPGSHPNANNDSAIPTAGGQKLGGVGEGVGHSGSHAGVHQTVGDKVKNALPGQHGNAHDAHGNPINASTTGSHTTGSHTTGSYTGSHTTGSHTGSHTTGGLTGSDHSHSHVGGSNNTYNNQPSSGFSSSAQPLSHDSNFNERHSGPGVGTGLAAGAVGGAGLASAGHHNSHNQTSSGLTGNNTHNTHNSSGLTGSQHSSGLTGSNTHNTSGVVGEDNRGIIDKAKDTLSSKRSNHPDDPITGTNYDQKNRDQYTSGTHGSGVTGSSHGNYAHTSSTQQPGVAGITKGVDQTHLGSNTHSGVGHSHGSSNVSHEGRSAEWKEGYQAGYREATLSFGSHSNTHSSTTGAHPTSGTHSGSHIGSTGTHSSTTGTGYNNTTTKPTLGDKLNPKTDADRDGKVGILD